MSGQISFVSGRSQCHTPNRPRLCSCASEPQTRETSGTRDFVIFPGHSVQVSPSKKFPRFVLRVQQQDPGTLEGGKLGFPVSTRKTKPTSGGNPTYCGRPQRRRAMVKNISSGGSCPTCRCPATWPWANDLTSPTFCKTGVTTTPTWWRCSRRYYASRPGSAHPLLLDSP